MDKRQYLDNLKTIDMRPGEVRIERKEEILMENPEPILQELFITQSEIEAMPKGNTRDIAILRLGIVAELDAANLYERLAALASNSDISKVMLDVAKEEKVHAGEFEALLERVDKEYEDAEEEGEKEVEDLTGGE
jgi:rubrerythrin